MILVQKYYGQTLPMNIAYGSENTAKKNIDSCSIGAWRVKKEK